MDRAIGHRSDTGGSPAAVPVKNPIAYFFFVYFRFLHSD